MWYIDSTTKRTRCVYTFIKIIMAENNNNMKFVIGATPSINPSLPCSSLDPSVLIHLEIHIPHLELWTNALFCNAPSHPCSVFLLHPWNSFMCFWPKICHYYTQSSNSNTKMMSEAKSITKGWGINTTWEQSIF